MTFGPRPRRARVAAPTAGGRRRRAKSHAVRRGEGHLQRPELRPPDDPHEGWLVLKREDWDARYAGSLLLWTAEPNRFLVAEADGLRPGRALDLASGEGRNAVWLAERGWRVTAVDFSPVALAKARALAARRGVDV